MPYRTVLLAVLLVVLSLARPQAQAADAPVVLINTFTVPQETVAQTIQMWEAARAFLRGQPGYISTKLHQSLSPDASFQLINVAEWESAEAFRAATAKMREQKILRRLEGVSFDPQLYQVIRD